MSFVDEYSICFDSEDENKLEYTSIHDVRMTNFLTPSFFSNLK